MRYCFLRKILAAFVTVAALAGCAEILVDRGFSESEAWAIERGCQEVIAPLPDETARQQTAK